FNPVRAKIVAEPIDYAWSSFGANAVGVADDLITPHVVYAGLDESREKRQAAYRCLFGSSISDDDLAVIRDATQHAWALGDAAFRTKIGVLNRRGQRLRVGRPGKRNSP